jgi:hypothetical protein
MPICSLAAATRRSAEAMSGRRCSSVDGTPVGTSGTTTFHCAGASVKSLAALPSKTAIACSSVARWRSKRDLVDAGVGELGLRLQQVGFRRDAGVEAVLRDLQHALEAFGGGVEQRLFGVCLAQREVVDRQLALRRQARGGQVGGAGLQVGGGAVSAGAQLAPDVRLPAGADVGAILVAGLRIAAAGALWRCRSGPPAGNSAARCSVTSARACA